MKPTSPAINAGNPNFNASGFNPPLDSDYRGPHFTRVSGGRIDLGAYEAQTLSLVVDSLVDENDEDHSVGDLSLREAVILTNQNPGADQISFAASLFAADPGLALAKGVLTLNDDLSLIGPGSAVLTIDALHHSQIFNGTFNSTSFEIRGMTLTNGSAYAVNGIGVAGGRNWIWSGRTAY